MNLKFIIFILIILVAIYIYIKMYKNETNNVHEKFNENNVSQDNNEQLNDSEVDNDDDDIHTDDVETFFNMSDEPTDVDISTSANIVYLDVEYLGNRGRILISLNNEVTPKTCNNFFTLCDKKAYKGCKFHRIVKNFMIQGGDFTNNDGTGGVSIYGNVFPDENFKLSHEKGVISMANSGPNTNGSQFFITTTDTNWLDGKHVVFGKVIKGMDLIEFLENVNTDNNDCPSDDIIIVDCGSL